jgi:dolichol-phosphate mannosyltransferase
MQERASVAATSGFTFTRAARALRHPANWVQLAKFCVVGVSGYLVNLAVYAVLLKGAGLHYLAAGACSFAVAAANNYFWNRHWTFRRQRGHVYYQGIRFLIVSLVALGANLIILHLLVVAGLDKIPAQAIAIVLVTPLNFIGNKLWSFRR